MVGRVVGPGMWRRRRRTGRKRNGADEEEEEEDALTSWGGGWGSEREMGGSDKFPANERERANAHPPFPKCIHSSVHRVIHWATISQCKWILVR